MRLPSALPILILVLAVPSHTTPAESPAEIVSSQVESAFRSAMEAWAYEQYWKLWEMGTNLERLRVTQNDFSDRMRAGLTRPVAGRQIEAMAVQVNSLESAMVLARITIDRRHLQRQEVVSRSFLFKFEDGSWRIVLYDFQALAGY